MGISLILTACIYVFGGITVAVINNLRSIRHSAEQKDHLIGAVRIYDLINNCMAETSASRIIVFKTHNGGGRPSLSCKFEVSAMFGSNLRMDTKEKFQNLMVDEAYTRMLLEIIKGKKKLITTSEMESSLLQRIYKDEEIGHAIVYPLCVTSTGFFFMSVSQHENYEGIELFNESNGHKFELLKQSLNHTFKEDEKKNNYFQRWVQIVKHKVTKNED